MSRLNGWPRHSATGAMLYTEYGQFSPKGFGSMIGAAKLLDECVSHEIRKAASRRLA